MFGACSSEDPSALEIRLSSNLARWEVNYLLHIIAEEPPGARLLADPVFAKAAQTTFESGSTLELRAKQSEPSADSDCAARLDAAVTAFPAAVIQRALECRVGIKCLVGAMEQFEKIGNRIWDEVHRCLGIGEYADPKAACEAMEDQDGQGLRPLYPLTCNEIHGPGAICDPDFSDACCLDDGVACGQGTLPCCTNESFYNPHNESSRYLSCDPLGSTCLATADETNPCGALTQMTFQCPPLEISLASECMNQYTSWFTESISIPEQYLSGGTWIDDRGFTHTLQTESCTIHSVVPTSCRVPLAVLDLRAGTWRIPVFCERDCVVGTVLCQRE
jgi:hypothetical protein